MIEINFPFQESKAERRRRRLKKAAIAAGALAAGAVVAWRVFDRYTDDEPEARTRRPNSARPAREAGQKRRGDEPVRAEGSPGGEPDRVAAGRRRSHA